MCSTTKSVVGFWPINTHRDVEWFNRERFAELVDGLCVAASVRSVTEHAGDSIEGVGRAFDAARELMVAAEASNFRVLEFLAETGAEAGTRSETETETETGRATIEQSERME